MRKTLIIALAATAAAMGLASCTQSQNEVANAIAAYGFSDVEVHGHDFFACAKDDDYATKFTAINAQGAPVEGVLCAGLLFKGATIRNLRVVRLPSAGGL